MTDYLVGSYFKITYDKDGCLKAQEMLPAHSDSRSICENDFDVMLDCRFEDRESCELAIGAIHKWGIEHILGGKLVSDR